MCTYYIYSTRKILGPSRKERKRRHRQQDSWVADWAARGGHNFLSERVPVVERAERLRAEQVGMAGWPHEMVQARVARCRPWPLRSP